MKNKKLKNPPLLEAIFELKWELKKKTKNLIKPNYQILPGMLYDKLKDKYPEYEELPANKIPSEIAPYIIQHRFRQSQNQWPLFQLGSGILTFNDTKQYTWNSFKDNISYLLENFYDLYPEKDKLIVNSLLLQYMNGIPIDKIKNNSFDFLHKKMGINIELKKELFDNSGINSNPLAFDYKFVFLVNEPEGALHLRLSLGKIKNIENLIWEHKFISQNIKLINSPENILKWLEKSHNILEKWFLELTKGDLYRSFL